MDSDATVCQKCDSLVPLADNVRDRGAERSFVCPVCHGSSPMGPLAKDLPGRSELEGLVEENEQVPPKTSFPAR